MLIAISFLVSFSALGQYSSLQSQYMFNPIALNPAATGGEDVMSAIGSFRAQWVGFDGAPTTESITVHAPLKDMNSSVGVQLYADQIGVDNRTTVNGLYSYRINMNNASLRLGISGGLSLIQSNYSELQVFAEDDQEISSNTQVGVQPNFGIGAYYTAEKYFASFSIPTLLGHRFEDNQFRSFSDLANYNFLLGGGYEFDLKNEMGLKPSILMKFRANNRVQFDFNTKLKLNERFDVGLSYRTEEAIIGMFEAKITNQFYAMYSFGMPISKIAKYTFGSHEIGVKYNFVYKSNTQGPRFAGW
ncbi:MAG: type IX secretion system membrane protein PorP/SprF [Crocinitomicaceae bacterium]|nr:type IX secretion system membrane protein PorP/SprF [Crocinitomicaceae bacterium]